jgi:hypothetical protein
MQLAKLVDWLDFAAAPQKKGGLRTVGVLAYRPLTD